jgi:formylglycine-generating enzyme required for sulfatase activity
MLQEEVKIRAEMKKIGLNEQDISKMFQSYNQSNSDEQTQQFNINKLEEAKKINVKGKLNYQKLLVEILNLEATMTTHERLVNELLQAFNLPIGSGNSKQEIKSLTQFVLRKIKHLEDSIYYYAAEKFERIENVVNETGNLSLDIARVTLGGVSEIKARKNVFGYLQYFKIKDDSIIYQEKAKDVVFTRELKEFWLMPIQVQGNDYKVGLIARYKMVKGNSIPQEDTTVCEGCTEIQRKIAEEIASTMLSISGGTFSMGCEASEKNCEKDEFPNHTVSLSDFRINKYEVTQSQWLTIMNTKPSDFKGCESCPVEQVSWEDAQAFIDKLNKLTGKSYRLPTEAEWEYAARGGKSEIYSGSNMLNEVAWFGDNSGNETHPVGQKAANGYGIYDMSGNVWEWCNDWYGEYSSNSQTNPQGPSNGLYRVIRGGSWNNKSKSCKVSSRYNNSRSNRYYNLGFRLAHTF